MIIVKLLYHTQCYAIVLAITAAPGFSVGIGAFIERYNAAITDRFRLNDEGQYHRRGISMMADRAAMITLLHRSTLRRATPFDTIGRTRGGRDCALCSQTPYRLIIGQAKMKIFQAQQSFIAVLISKMHADALPFLHARASSVSAAAILWHMLPLTGEINMLA